MSPTTQTVAAFYRFAPLSDLEARRQRLHDLAAAQGIKGTILLAGEGVNATIAGSDAGITTLLDELRGWDGFRDLAPRFSISDTVPFRRLKVKIKREIVTLATPMPPKHRTGRYVAPADWDALALADDVLVIDTRNTYETVIGSFVGAIDPGLASFGDFPNWWSRHHHQFQGKRIAMFCTGGIRCDKAASWLAEQGTHEVAQLEGGILAYLATIEEARSSWWGECFVFDERVALKHGLAQGSHRLCQPCGHPMPADDRHCRQCGARNGQESAAEG